MRAEKGARTEESPGACPGPRSGPDPGPALARGERYRGAGSGEGRADPVLTRVPAPPAAPPGTGRRGRAGTPSARARVPAPPRPARSILRGGRPRLEGAPAIGDSGRRREEKSNKRARRQTRDLGKGRGGGEGGDGHTDTASDTDPRTHTPRTAPQVSPTLGRLSPGRRGQGWGRGESYGSRQSEIKTVKQKE